MINNENEKIKNIINFYMLANKLKYANTDKKQSVADQIYGSIEIDLSNLEREDAITRLKQLPNKRYGELLRLRYVESFTNEETANKLGTTMENYYNLHKRAKEQYDKVYGKEGQHA